MRNNLIVRGQQEFNGKMIPVVLGGFGEGKRCLTDKMIAEIHGIQVRHARETISKNINRFKENVDFIDLKKVGNQITNNLSDGLDSRKKDVVGEVDNNLLDGLGYTKMQIVKSERIYLLSERGYAKLIKIMDSDLAWEIHDKLIDEYFQLKEVVQTIQQGITTEDVNKMFTILVKPVLEQSSEILTQNSEMLSQNIKLTSQNIEMNTKLLELLQNTIDKVQPKEESKVKTKLQSELFTPQESFKFNDKPKDDNTIPNWFSQEPYPFEKKQTTTKSNDLFGEIFGGKRPAKKSEKPNFDTVDSRCDEIRRLALELVEAYNDESMHFNHTYKKIYRNMAIDWKRRINAYKKRYGLATTPSKIKVVAEDVKLFKLFKKSAESLLVDTLEDYESVF